MAKRGGTLLIVTSCLNCCYLLKVTQERTHVCSVVPTYSAMNSIPSNQRTFFSRTVKVYYVNPKVASELGHSV